MKKELKYKKKQYFQMPKITFILKYLKINK